MSVSVLRRTWEATRVLRLQDRSSHRQAKAKVGLNGASTGPVSGSEVVLGSGSETESTV